MKEELINSTISVGDDHNIKSTFKDLTPVASIVLSNLLSAQNTSKNVTDNKSQSTSVLATMATARSKLSREPAIDPLTVLVSSSKHKAGYEESIDEEEEDDDDDSGFGDFSIVTSSKGDTNVSFYKYIFSEDE